MPSIADVHFTAALDDSRLQVDAKKSGNKAGLTLGQQLSLGLKKSFTGENLGKGLVQGLGLAGALGAANLLSTGLSAVVGGIGDSIDAASDLNETISKGKIIFGENADEMEAWAATASTEFGQSKRAALDTASTFAGLFDTVGLALDDATDKSKALTLLGSDLASFFNTDVQQAMDALRSGLSGESEPLRKFNVFLSETAVSAKAVELGFKKVNGQFTEGEKVQARYAIIMDQTSLAQGDFARTSDGLANKQRTLDAKLEDVSATLGQALIPVAIGATEALIGLADVVTTLVDLAGRGAAAIDQGLIQPLVALSKIGREGDLAELQADLELLKAGGKPADPARDLLEILRGIARIGQEGDLQEVAGDLEAASSAGVGAVSALGSVAEGFGPKLAEGLRSGGSMAAKEIDVIATTTVESFGNMGANWAKVARAQGNRAGSAIADGINQARSEVDDAWDALLLGLKNAMTPTQERAKLLGFLASKELAKGLKSGDPAVKAQANATKQIIIDRLLLLGANTKNIGKKSMDELKRAMKSKDPDIRAAATQIYKAATQPLAKIPPKAKTYGYNTGAAYAAGLRKTYGLVNDAAHYVASGATGAFKASSPPGPKSPLHLIDVWGERTIQAWADGMRSKAREALAATRDVASMAAGGFGMTPAYAGLGAVASLPSSRPSSFAGAQPLGAPVAGRTPQVTVNVQGLLKARNPLEVAQKLQRFADIGAFDVKDDWS